MKKVYLLLFFGLISIIVNAQVIEKKISLFEQTRGNDAVELTDGGYVLVGEDHDTDQGKVGALILKLNEVGDTSWKKFYHQIDGTSTTFNSVVGTADGGIVTMGSSIKYNTPDPGNVTSTVVMKFDADGTEIWTKSFANPGDILWNTAIGSHLSAYTDGGVIISINIGSLTCGGAAFMRLAEDGSVLWSRNYHGAGSGRDILVLPDGQIYLTGSVVEEGEYKAHFTHVNPEDGAQIFSRLIDFELGDTYGRELLYDGEHVYLAGSNAGQMFLVKFTNDGEYNGLWSLVIGESIDVSLSAEVVGDRIVLAGVKYEGGQSSILTMFDFDGNLIDDYVFSNVGGTIDIRGISETESGSLLTIGTFNVALGTNSTIYFGKSGFPLPSFCAMSNLDFEVLTTEAIITIPAFVTADSPIERPIAIERHPQPRISEDDYCSLSEIKYVKNISNRIHIFPNPTQSQLVVESTAPVQCISIYNAQGMLIKTLEALKYSYTNSVDVSSFVEGIYFVKVTTESGVFTKQIIKR